MEFKTSATVNKPKSRLREMLEVFDSGYDLSREAKAELEELEKELEKYKVHHSMPSVVAIRLSNENLS